MCVSANLSTCGAAQGLELASLTSKAVFPEVGEPGLRVHSFPVGGAHVPQRGRLAG